MNEILVAVVSAVGLIAVAIIANRGRQHAKAAREQVENSHSTNFRDEFDSRHYENSAKLDSLVEWQAQHEGKSTKRDTRITRVELVLLPAILAAVVNTIVAIIRKR